jgi:hypothetical protein
VDVLTPLSRWVADDGVAPASLTFPVTAQTTGSGVDALTVAPFDPTAPAPRNSGLNSNYSYVSDS